MKLMNLSKYPRRAARRGMTLVELMVGIAIGSLVLTAVSVTLVGSSLSFAAMGNYIDLDQSSRSALDQMSRDVRRSANLNSFATNQVVFNFAGSTNLTYSYDAASGNLTAQKTGDAAATVLLTGCSYLRFSMYGSVPVPGGNLTNAATVSQAKAISVCWRCSRTILGQKRNTEDMQEAIIVIRNKPVS
jgi:prepilin-type N-terminal cleavage/methylation domain-containing protein